MSTPAQTTETVIDPELLKKISVQLTDEGKLMEAGWIGLRLATGLTDAPTAQLREMRMAFFAGAQHVFHTIMTIMDDDREPTEDDLRRVEFIDAELQAFIRDFTGAKHDA